jgi:hypothetical protein
MPYACLLTTNAAFVFKGTDAADQENHPIFSLLIPANTALCPIAAAAAAVCYRCS